MKTLLMTAAVLVCSMSVAWAQPTVEDIPDAIAHPVTDAIAHPVTEAVEFDEQQARSAQTQPASAKEMEGIWHSLRWARDDTGRAAVLAAVADRYWLSAVQVEVLLETIADESARGTLLATLYPKITNPADIGRLVRLFPKADSRPELLQRT